MCCCLVSHAYALLYAALWQSLFEDIGVVEVRDFWLVEKGDLQQAGFNKEQIDLFMKTLKAFDNGELSGQDSPNGSPERNTSRTSKPQTAPAKASKASSSPSSSASSPSSATPSDDNSIPQRSIDNLQAYFPSIDADELQWTLRNMNGDFKKSMMLLTSLYPNKRVMEPVTRDNILAKDKDGDKDGSSPGSGNVGKVGVFPLPPAAVENLAKQFPSLPSSEIEAALRHNRLNFVKSVAWLNARHPGSCVVRYSKCHERLLALIISWFLLLCPCVESVAAGSGPRGAKLLRRGGVFMDTR